MCRGLTWQRAYDGCVPKLAIVPPSAPSPAEKVRQRVRAMPKPASLLQCRCGCRELMEVRSGVEFYNGKARGGTKQMICLACMLKGERVVVV